MALTDKLTAIADAIRGKTGGTEGMTLDAMVSAIEGIESGGIPGVTVIKGEYIPGQTIASWGVKLIHGLGEIKPFYFFIKAHDRHQENAWSDSVYMAIVAVSFIEEHSVTYGADAVSTTITPKAQVCYRDFANASKGSVSGGVTIHASDTNTMANYGVNMWPDGFTVGLYRNLLNGVAYDYTLIYGDLCGGAV